MDCAEKASADDVRAATTTQTTSRRDDELREIIVRAYYKYYFFSSTAIEGDVVCIAFTLEVEVVCSPREHAAAKKE